MAEKNRKPTMFILAGANGSGKSTLYEKVIKPQINVPFINADEIQKTELKNDDPRASYEAAQIASTRREQFLKDKKSFATETVFSHESKLKLVKDAQEAGFNVALYHVGLRSASLNVKRVGLRVMKGGHDVPEEKIIARRERGEALISAAARLSDRAFVYDNSNFNGMPTLGIEFREGKVVGVGENLPKWQRDVYEADLERYSAARLNPAAASYEIVDRMAKDITGDNNVRASIPRQGQSYSGPLVGESAQHILQRTGADSFVAHFRNVIGNGHKLGVAKEIEYQSRNKAKVQDIRETSIENKPRKAFPVLKAGVPLTSDQQNDAQSYLVAAKARLDAMEQSSGQKTATAAFTKMKDAVLPLLNDKQQRHWEPPTKDRGATRSAKDDDYGR